MVEPPDTDPVSRLAPCPRKRNCVSTLAHGRLRMDPIPYTGSQDAARQRLLGILRAWPRTRIVAEEPAYLHAECRSLLGFVDDVEFAFAAGARLIHFRSAARLGSYDFGVNRQRMEAIRGMFLRAEKDPS